MDFHTGLIFIGVYRLIIRKLIYLLAPTKIQNQRCLGAPKKLTETSAVSQDVQIREEMTKLTDGSGHITDFLRIPNKPAFG
jgi:hypothetical protein